MTPLLRTNRLTLRPFGLADLSDFDHLNSDINSMADLGGPLTRAKSKAKLLEYLSAARRDGLGRLHVSDAEGFIGYVGVRGHDDVHPLGAHFEIGWRLLSRAWGKGYATEAARGALTDAFSRTGAARILAYTAPDNARSRAVMERLNLRRHPELDFDEPDPVLGLWHGQVWVAEAADWAGGIE